MPLELPTAHLFAKGHLLVKAQTLIDHRIGLSMTVDIENRVHRPHPIVNRWCYWLHVQQRRITPPGVKLRRAHPSIRITALK
jgi:hypothetical protein